MKKLKKILSILLILTIIMPILPIGEIIAYAEGVQVTKIEVARTMDELRQPGTYKVIVHGKNVDKADISYSDSDGPNYHSMGTPLPGSGKDLRQYAIEAGKPITAIKVNTTEFEIRENDMPEIKYIKDSEGKDTRQFDLTGKEEELKIIGEHFDKFGKIGEITTNITIGNKTANDYFDRESPVSLNRDTLRIFGLGRQNISIKRKSKVDDVDITISYYQKNAFRIYESLIIDEDDITIYPSRGKVKTPVEITIENKEVNYSVFFKEEEEDFYMLETMGEETQYPPVIGGKTTIRTKVPKGLKTGRNYKVYLTNNVDNEARGKKDGYDLTPFVTQEKCIGEFYVVDATTGPSIDKVVPEEGSSDGAYVTIHGYRLEELKIPKLNIKNTEIDKDNMSIPPVGIDEPTRLKLKYKTDEKTTYREKEVEEITRDFLVTIGRNAIFEEEYLNEQKFQDGDSKEDILYVKTNTISQEDLKDPVKDVVVLITTEIKVKGEDKPHIFTELAILPKGYTFLVSSQDPIIKQVTPSQIQVNSINDLTTKNDTIISIQGEKFNVFRYEDRNTTKTNYPKIVIGGTNEDNAQLVIEKTSENTVKYYKKGIEQIISDESKENIVFEVLDKEGNVIDGIGRNEEGTSIVLTIPKGILVGKEIINTKVPVAISNPKRDTSDRRTYNYRNDMISFVTAEPSPTIESVNPWRVTTLGGEEIVVTGNGFLDGIKVYIHGVEVKGVKREIDKITTKGKLTFKAPKGLEGRTVLMIQNPDGGSDTHEFIYVQTENIDPKLTNIIPNRGTEDDIIILRGDNFLKPDPTIKNLSGIGIDKLIGTTVKIGGIDVNEYNPGKELKDYSGPEKIDGNLIEKQENPLLGTTSLGLNKAYKNALIKSGSNIYTIRKNKEGTMDIVGEDNIYTFFLEDSIIKSRDENGIEYNTIIEKDRIILKTSNLEKVFDISYNFDIFSIIEDGRGGKSLKVSDYYNSIYLWDETESKYFIISKDEKGRVLLTDGRNENYEVKMIGDEIHAGNNKLNIKKGSISLGNKDLKFKTPYKTEGEIIVGHRIEILNSGEIEVKVPRKEIPKKYDVTVTNPDTKSSTIKLGFEYISSAEQPEIFFIEPPEGTIEGGYVITIGGARFDKDTKVLIDGVPGTNVVVDQTNYGSLKVRVPKYRGTEEDFVSQKKFVRVHVITRTGQASTKEMFAYKLTSSKPSIKLLDSEGSTAGGKIIRLVGKDLRFYEPFTGNPPTAISIPGIDYEDLDGDKKWTNILSDKQKEARPVPLTPPTPDYDKYLSSPVLPVITFGNNRGKIVEFIKQGDEYLIQVVLPESDMAGSVDVILTNNDRAQSNVVKFNYKASKPTIKSISPPNARRMGGEIRNIEADGYVPSKIKTIGSNGKEAEITMNLIRFGDNTNKNINIDDYDAGGRIRNGNSTVNLGASGLKAELKNNQITLSISDGDDEYIGTYELSEGTKYINVGALKGKNNKDSYKGLELVKVTIKPEGKLEIERGFSPLVKDGVRGVLSTTVPSYYRTGNVDVVLVNKDGESNKVKFEYTNPGSQPKVTNILRDGVEPKIGSDGRERTQQISAKGGSLIRIIGSDFRDNPNPTIIIGNNDIVIPSSAVTFENDKELTFIMPVVNQALEGKLLNLIVQNDDKGTGQSIDNVPPLYVQIITGETNPTTGNITPDKGPVSGGTEVTITGTDFREIVEGFNGKLEIFFGENKVEEIISFSHNKIVLRTPKGDKPGVVPVKIVNPDGTPTDNNIIFTYISEPKIFDVNPKSIFINDDETEITITGEMFMEGAKVTINKKEALDVKFIDDKTLKVKFPQTDKVEKTIIQVINPDGGESNEYTDFRYEKPIPLKPMVLEAIPGYESTVKLIWSKSDKKILNETTKYEIYGRKISDQENTFLGDTTNADFLVKALEPNVEYEFLVRALNEHGAAIDFATVKVTTLSLGEDAKLREKEEKRKSEENKFKREGKEEIQDGRLIITLGTEVFKNGLGTVDLTLSKYKNQDKVTISIPIALGRTDNRLTIKDGTMTTVINVRDLYTLQVSRLDKGDKDAYLRIHIDQTVEQHIPRGKRATSKAYELYFDYIYEKDLIEINEILRNGKLSLSHNTIVYPTKKNTALYVLDVETGNYKGIKGTTTDIKGRKKVILLSER